MGGSWEFYPLYGTVCDTSLPDELPEAESITVPSGWKAPGIALRDFNPGDIYGYPGRWNDADTGVLRRRVHISAEPGERVFLNAEGVAQRCALYVGARHICDHDEMFLPLHADITDGIADGEAEITFVCASFESTTLTSGSVKTTGLTGSWFGSNLRGKGRGLTGTLEPALSGTRPAHGVSASIGKSDDSIIERGLDVSHTKGHVLLFSFLGNAFWSSHDLLP